MNGFIDLNCCWNEIKYSITLTVLLYSLSKRFCVLTVNGTVLYKYTKDVIKLDGICIVLTLTFLAYNLLHISNQAQKFIVN
jgi:hypothetical protein